MELKERCESPARGGEGKCSTVRVCCLGGEVEPCSSAFPVLTAMPPSSVAGLLQSLGWQ